MLNYSIIGGGRLARHFSHYFQLLGVPHSCWARDANSSFNTHSAADGESRLRQTLEGADRVLLLVSDRAIPAVLERFPVLHEKTLIHCSGSLSIDGVAAAHPLMTFSDSLYEPGLYQTIPFVLESGYRFEDLFPDLPNPHFSVGAGQKARYHALCVMAGNFAQLMWKHTLDRFEAQFEWPQEILSPYLRQVTENFIRNPDTALTGPLVRNDEQTINSNLDALDGDPLQSVYAAFVKLHQDHEQMPGISDSPRMGASS